MTRSEGLDLLASSYGQEKMLFEYGFLAGVVAGLGNLLAGVWSTLANPVTDHPLLFAAAGVLLLALVLRRR